MIFTILRYTVEYVLHDCMGSNVTSVLPAPRMLVMNLRMRIRKIKIVLDASFPSFCRVFGAKFHVFDQILVVTVSDCC